MLRAKCSASPSDTRKTMVTLALRLFESTPSSSSRLYTMSFSFSLRKCFALMPRTKLMASIMLDFPEPFGPMMQVNLSNGPISWSPS